MSGEKSKNMIDEKGNVITREKLIKRYYSFAKENTAQIAVAIPVVAAICAAISNYYFYMVNLGYYEYFGIDSRLMLPYNKVNLYQNIGQLALLVLYWGYAIFAVRMFIIKRNFLWKFITLFVIPFLINCAMSYDGRINLVLIIVSTIFLPLQWIMIFSLGYCMVTSFHKESLSKPRKMNRKKKKVKRWSDKEYRLLGIILMFIACIIIFWQGYFTSYIIASEKSRFGIVKIDGEEYAVIDANENKLVLQKCEMKNNNLKIYKDTYLCVTNDVIINFKNFSSVEFIKD